jgi:FAD dependent oxidoreductase TIGR03364
MVERQYDDIVVGAGVLGLAHAYHLSRRGRRVAVLERDAAAVGASVRNFGMLWPIGQPLGPLRALARRSLEFWLKVLDAAGLPYERSGSLHLAYHDDEAQVLREYEALSRAAGEPVELLTPSRVDERSRAVKQEGLCAALWSAEEVCIDPRVVITGLPGWLERNLSVRFHFGTTVTEVDMPSVRAGGQTWTASRLWICSGSEFDTLFPGQAAAAGIVRCKLQMMRTRPVAEGWRLGPMLAGGLTLRHYRSFEECPTLPALRARVARETPWFDLHGIHVLVSQNSAGELSLGDSHEYGEPVSPFDKTDIDDLILTYLYTFFDVPALKIRERWHGVYAKHPRKAHVVLQPAPETVMITGVGGAGMTLSFGLAEQVVRRELGEAEMDSWSNI